MSTQRVGEELLTPGGVAAMLYVDPKTVTRWAEAGKLNAIRTPGGHRRYRKSEVVAIMGHDHPDAVTRAVDVVLEQVADQSAREALVASATARRAARRVVEAARIERSRRADVATRAARDLVQEADRTAARVRFRAEVAAQEVQRFAGLAADDLRRHSDGAGGSGDDARAVELSLAVSKAAEATSKETRRAAAVVTDAAVVTAHRLALDLWAAEAGIEARAVAAAQALRRETEACAEQAERQSRAHRAGIRLTAREAAAVMIPTPAGPTDRS